jgi:Kef-type K+ transport system membrane component KefB
VALSLLVLFGFSNATAAIGFSDSLGAFLAGLVLAGTPYAHDIIAELRAFKGLFLSLFFVTIGTTIDLPLAIDLFPIVLVMTAGLMAGKVGVVTALGPITGLTWRESLVAGAFLAQGGEFAFVIFGQVRPCLFLFPKSGDAAFHLQRRSPRSDRLRPPVQTDGR